jgi:hypothetical protein
VGLFDNLKGRASEAVDAHGDKIAQGIDKVGDFVDEKTGGQHSDKVDLAQEKAKEVLDGLDGQKDDLP